MSQGLQKSRSNIKILNIHIEAKEGVCESMLSGQFSAVFVQLESAKYHDILFQAKGKQVEMNFFRVLRKRGQLASSLAIKKGAGQEVQC